MRRQKCAECGTMLDVSKLEKGSKTACFNCGAISVVGQAAVTKRSLKDTGKAFKRRAQKEEAPVVQRTRRPRAEAAPAAEGKSKLPLFIGIGAVVVIGIVVAVMMSGKDAGGGKKGPTAADWWAGKVTQIGVADKKTLESWIDEAKAKGYDQDQAFWAPKLQDIMKQILRRDPQDDKANVYAKRKSLRDYPGFQGLWEAMFKYYTALPEEQKQFYDKYADLVDRKKAVWLTADKYESAAATLQAFAAWKKKRDENPAAEKVNKAIATAKALLKDHGFVTAVEGPFILLMPYDTKEDGAEARKAELEKMRANYVQPLRVALAQFEKLFRSELKLDPIQEGRYFIQVVLDRREDFATFLQGETGFEPAGDVSGFFSPRTRWAGVAVSKEKELAPFIGPHLAHEATHQLQHYFSKDWNKKWDPNYFDEWNCIWFTEGLAEYIGGGVQFDAESGKSEWTGFAQRRVEYLQGMKDNGVPLIPVRDLVQLSTLDDWARYVNGTWLPLLQEDEDMPESAGTWLRDQAGRVTKAMYAHSWYLTRFLMDSGKGKYRAQYRDLMMTALRGKAKPAKYRKDANVRERWASPFDAFAEIMGLKADSNWDKLQKEYRRYLNRMLREAK